MKENLLEKNSLSFLSSTLFSLPYTLFILPSLTSLLLILSYPKFNLGFLAWFALAPLTVAILKVKNIKSALACGFITGFFFYLGILYWIYITIRAGGGSVGVSLIGWVALSFLLSFEFVHNHPSNSETLFNTYFGFPLFSSSIPSFHLVISQHSPSHKIFG